jgi:hypothetical protein
MSDEHLDEVAGGPTVVEYAVMLSWKQTPEDNRMAIAVEKQKLLPDMER